ncbi:SipW-dependent-type signal peptide-containing protein [Marmoricola sp. RAF53]|uniref:SipW-dependent-type signal peptide-containing protein n=1 Tax=Marmoricola sp. RAF53 TaxID=3233059 RepID=UPI003F94D5E5
MSLRDLTSPLRSTRSRALLSLGVVAGLAATGTFALWNDSVTVSGTSISTGSIDLVVNDDTDDAVAFTQINVSGLLPGGTTAGVLKVSNTGASPLTYYATAAVGGTVFPSSVLTVKITAATATSPVAGGSGATCAGSAIAGLPTGFATGNFIGSSSAQRPLASGATEYFCVQATLDPNADQTTYSSKTTTVGLTFTASQ